MITLNISLWLTMKNIISYYGSPQIRSICTMAHHERDQIILWLIMMRTKFCLGLVRSRSICTMAHHKADRVILLLTMNQIKLYEHYFIIRSNQITLCFTTKQIDLLAHYGSPWRCSYDSSKRGRTNSCSKEVTHKFDVQFNSVSFVRSK